MPGKNTKGVIRMRGVRHNNLKNLDLDLPKGRLVVFTGLSGSGKSSLAFDTLFAEGQRRYVETFSPYVRQFFDRMDKPRVDHIEGIPPAIALGQANTVRTTRSTVGTMTEICDHMKHLWPYLSRCHCSQCDAVVCRDEASAIWQTIRRTQVNEALVTFEVSLAEGIPLEESIQFIGKQGYRRVLLPRGKPRLDQLPEAVQIEEVAGRLAGREIRSLAVVQDRVRLKSNQRARFIEACEQAFHFGAGCLSVWTPKVGRRRFSRAFHCATCDIEYRDPSPALFSFNNPVGACPECRGFGRVITIDLERAIPDHGRTLAEGVVKPWQTGRGTECQGDLIRFCRKRGVPTDVRFKRLPRKLQQWVVDGDSDYGKDAAHRWPRAWYGVRGYFRWLESKAYKMHVRVLLSRYRVYSPCPSCGGRRFKPESLQYMIPASANPKNNSSTTLADFYLLTIAEAGQCLDAWAKSLGLDSNHALASVFEEVRGRLRTLVDIGLGYITLDRPTRTLSGGETQRVNLTSCLGSRLVNTLYVLDEPSIGLHPRDTERLVGVLRELCDLGNTLAVVEHEPAVIRAADQVVDLGPGRGEGGGQLIFQGTPNRLLNDRYSLTGAYLSGRKTMQVGSCLPVHPTTPRLKLSGVTLNNLRNFSVSIPLGRLVCVSGVSGSGKTTLVRGGLFPALQEQLGGRTVSGESGNLNNDVYESAAVDSSTGNRLTGWKKLSGVTLVDQSLLARTPRSNPALYIGAFAGIRQLFAKTDEAGEKGLGPGAFSFNSSQGQCHRCRGAGFEKVEMQFLSDVFIRCADCDGSRFQSHILEVKLAPTGKAAPAWNVADLLHATVDEVCEFLGELKDSNHARRAREKLTLLSEVGLGYLRLGQPLNTLSGGESQRLKLVRSLSERPSDNQGRGMFIFDEPTTGLHFDDIRLLLEVFRRMVAGGDSVLVVEHNLELIRQADWVIDLGPEAGDAGGLLVAEGPPALIAKNKNSHTGKALRAG